MKRKNCKLQKGRSAYRVAIFILHFSYFISLCLLPVLLTGCRTPQMLERSESGGVAFERLHVEYEFDQPMRQLSRGFDANPQSIVDNDVEPVAWTEQWSLARLTVECPHPSGRTDVARLTLTMSTPGPNGRGIVEEQRLLAVPRQQIDLLIVDLAQAGCFDESLTSTGDARLQVQIDHGQVDRSWKSDGRLLDFAHRTLTRGMLLKQPEKAERRESAEAGRGMRS